MRGIKDEGITRWEDTMKQLKEATPVDQVAGVGATLEENITLEASAEGDGMVEEEDAGTAGGELTN